MSVSRFPRSGQVLRTVFPTTCDRHGPGYTCAHLVSGIRRIGKSVSLHVNRYTLEFDRDETVTSIPRFLNHLPYRTFAEGSSIRSEQAYLSEIRNGDIAWLWPSATLNLHEQLAERGIPIVLEAINSRMSVAKEILDAAYIEAGLAPAHGITAERIAEEDEKWALANAIFSPSPTTDRAAIGTPLEGKLLKSSYGCQLPAQPVTARQIRDRVEFVFVGQVCIRKGADRLIRLWRDMPKNFHLTLVGELEPALVSLLDRELDAENVTLTGFVSDTRSYLQRSDVFVFPSLEEGDALVTYEAASAGLALLTSPVGSGRIGAETGCCEIFDPYDADAMKATLLDIGLDFDKRVHLAERALRAVQDYSWDSVASRRAGLLAPLFAAARVSGAEAAAEIRR